MHVRSELAPLRSFRQDSALPRRDRPGPAHIRYRIEQAYEPERGDTGGMEAESMLAVALRQAAQGHPVLPCVPGKKRPLTRHGLLDASTDPEQIRAWWRRTPTANLAGTTRAASHDVLDIDVHPTGTGSPAFTRLIRAGLAD